MQNDVMSQLLMFTTAPYPQGGPQYGGVPAGPPGGQQGSPAEIAAYKDSLVKVVQEKRLQNVYPPNDQRLDRYAAMAPGKINHVCQRFNIPLEVGRDLVKLALFDIILYIDDSGSMEFGEREDGRITQLKTIMDRVVLVATIFDEDGINIRFMNTDPNRPGEFDRINSEQQVRNIMGNFSYGGYTPMGQKMQEKIVGPLILGPAERGQLQKPVLVITITDGSPTDSPHHDIKKVIRDVSARLGSMPRYGAGVISFEFAQVGRDEQATKFLAKLDNDPEVGSLIDCTSSEYMFQELSGLLR